MRHLQNASDIAQHKARLQFTESDDLRHLIAAIFRLHISNHLIATRLTKINIEIRHRNTFGVQEPLEQQIEAQRVKIGNRQRPGHHRTGTGAATGADGNILGFGPFDEVGND